MVPITNIRREHFPDSESVGLKVLGRKDDTCADSLSDDREVSRRFRFNAKKHMLGDA